MCVHKNMHVKHEAKERTYILLALVIIKFVILAIHECNKTVFSLSRGCTVDEVYQCVSFLHPVS